MTDVKPNYIVWSLGTLLLALGLPLAGQADRGYAGAKACAKCHAEITHEWAESRHRKMLQPATEASVQGDFAQGKIVLRGSTYLLQHHDGAYFVTESSPAGKPQSHRVDYTLGERRIQQYLTTVPGGRIMILPVAWSIAGRKWLHALDVQNPEESPGVSLQVWNKSCYSCHVSQAQKNLENGSYHTAWQDFGINCESCHGPGGEHVAMAGGVKVLDAGTRGLIRETIVNPGRLDSARSTMVCAACHSSRDAFSEGFQAGTNFYDFFLPRMQYRLPAPEDTAYWVDGRPRAFGNDTLAFWQSQCFLRGGATCLTCHAPAHNVNVEQNAQLRPDNQALCARCHAAIVANLPAHTHHAANSRGSSCVECHMPATVAGLGARMRDHAISIPVPENTIRHGIPNACNLCHNDQDAEWARRQMNAWYGDKSRRKLARRADAFSEAQTGNPAAIQGLREILSDASEGPVIRANAAGYLGQFPNNPTAYAAVLNALSDSQPLVRATAAAAIRPLAAQREEVAPRLVSLLGDAVAGVRLNAVIALVTMGVRQVPPGDDAEFERAQQLYRARAKLHADDAQKQFAAGRFFTDSGDLDRAVAAFRAARKLDPAIAVNYDLALAWAQKGEFQAARQALKAMAPNDPQYAAGQRLLAQIELREFRQRQPNRAGAQALFLEGQVLYQDANYGAALPEFEQALRLAPQAAWARKAQSYRAVCLEKLSRTREAEAALRPLVGSAGFRGDVDLQLAYAELLYDSGRAEEALRAIDRLMAAVPKAPAAHFWRAKVLLQLRRKDEAARAAEECIRLLPDFSAAHNLLIRIYQMQGRAREAAQQAEWLRDYQRRMESH